MRIGFPRSNSTKSNRNRKESSVDSNESNNEYDTSDVGRFLDKRFEFRPKTIRILQDETEVKNTPQITGKTEALKSNLFGRRIYLFCMLYLKFLLETKPVVRKANLGRPLKSVVLVKLCLGELLDNI